MLILAALDATMMLKRTLEHHLTTQKEYSRIIDSAYDADPMSELNISVTCQTLTVPEYYFE